MKRYKLYASAIGIVLQGLLIGCTGHTSISTSVQSFVGDSTLAEDTCVLDTAFSEATMSEQERAEQEMAEQEMAEQEMAEQQRLEGTTWYYYQKEDDLTHEVTSINAIIISTNRVQFDSHGNTARMCLSLKYSSDGLSSLSTSVMLTFVEDNELCRFSDFKGSGFLAVFDNGEVDDRWSLIGMIDSRKALFMDMPSDVTPFVNKLKTSKNVRIQVNLEDVGKKTFDFNIAGLKWNFDK